MLEQMGLVEQSVKIGRRPFHKQTFVGEQIYVYTLIQTDTKKSALVL